jgi:hypothetical protein
MSSLPAPERALCAIVTQLANRRRKFALVGGLAVSIRAEVRFTRDVDLVVVVRDDADAEHLVRDLSTAGYRTIAVVEHESANRLSTARLAGPEGVVVDLLFASTGLEFEIAERAEPMELLDIGTVPVARGEELLAMKILSMRDARLQDRIDAQRLIEVGELDIAEVRADLVLIRERGFDRGQDLEAKLASVLDAVTRESEAR